MRVKWFGKSVITTLAIAAMIFILPEYSKAAQQKITNQEIIQAVETGLLINEGVSSHLIDVTSAEGIVTLSGTVDNILARDRAVQVAESIKGVRSIVNQIKVIPLARKDGNIQSDIEKALLQDPATDSYEVKVNVKGGIATLTGTVESWAEKQLSAQVAKGVKGVIGIENNITIQYKAERPDLEIKPEIERRLSLDPYIDDYLINVQVKNGEVSLSGVVGSAAERTHAYTNSWVAGVNSVDTSGLKIQWWADDKMVRNSKISLKTDREIEKAVEDAFLYDPRVYSFNVEATSRNGRVTLTGVVDNLKAKKAAEQDTKNTKGVYHVDNFIKVRPIKLLSDSLISTSVKNSLLWDPYVDRHEIKVMSRNGKVYLYGDVDSFYEKTRAEDVVSGVNGVIDVDNKLTVLTDWDWKSDANLKEDIEGELFWSMFVDSDDIDVEVDKGVATLTGTANSWHEVQAAIENAFEGGAKAVRSRLKVDKGPAYYPVYHYRDYHEWSNQNPWSFGWYTHV